MTNNSKTDEHNPELEREQRALFDDATDIIVHECLTLRRSALSILGEWGIDPLLGNYKDIKYDRTVFVKPLMILAKYWRIKHDASKFVSGFDLPDMQAQKWVHWLRDEVRFWFYQYPNFIANITAMLAYETKASKEIIENEVKIKKAEVQEIYLDGAKDMQAEEFFLNIYKLYGSAIGMNIGSQDEGI